MVVALHRRWPVPSVVLCFAVWLSGCDVRPVHRRDPAPIPNAIWWRDDSGSLRTLRIPFCDKGEECPAATDIDLDRIAEFSTLTELFVTRSEVTDAGLKQLSGLVRLKVLELHAPAVTDAGLEHLTGLKSLLVLKLGETQVTRAGVERFRQALPQCDVRVEWPAEVPDNVSTAP